MKFSAVVSYHTNPYTCGVARFNHSLAEAMTTPLWSLERFLNDVGAGIGLLSLKLEEIGESDLNRLRSALQRSGFTFDLLLHGLDGSALEITLCASARRVFAASEEIASRLRAERPDVVAVFAPGAPVRQRAEPVDCTLLTFGMAHKIRSDGYRRLAALMTSDPRSFRLDISTALHEGGTFDESFFTVGAEISQAFAGNVRFLGFLADAEVSERLRVVDALVAFFPNGARENNTTVLSAMTHGCPVITNLDSLSPVWMTHGLTLFDINRLSALPGKAELQHVGATGQRVAAEYSFEKLTRILLQDSPR